MKKVNVAYEWEVIYADNLGTYELSPYDLVIIANFSSFDEKSLENIKQYLKNGGVVLFFVGDKVDSVYYNEVLFKNLGHFLPCKLLEKKEVNDIIRPDVTKLDLFHPIIEPNKDKFSKFLARLMFKGYWEVECPSGEDKIMFRKVISLNDVNSTPLLFENSYENGHILWFNTTASHKWSTSSFVRPTGSLLLHNVIRYGISRRAENFNVAVGETFTYRLRSDTLLKAFEVKTPSGAKTNIEPVLIDPKTKTYEIKVAESDREGLREQGIYEVYSTTDPTHINFLISVNIDPAEGDLRKISSEEIKKINSKIEVIEKLAGEKEKKESDTLYKNIIKSVLYAAVALLFIEILLAYLFNMGRA
jgi:uncharacterized membrane protein